MDRQRLEWPEPFRLLEAFDYQRRVMLGQLSLTIGFLVTHVSPLCTTRWRHAHRERANDRASWRTPHSHATIVRPIAIFRFRSTSRLQIE